MHDPLQMVVLRVNQLMPCNREIDRHVYEAVYAASIKKYGKEYPQKQYGWQGLSMIFHSE